MKCPAVVALLVVLTASSILVTAITSALASTQTPAIPEFTVKLAEHPYDVPPVYSRDPYTGKDVMRRAGYVAENKSVEISIKLQPFTPYTDSSGNYVFVFYNVSYKGHYEEDWHYHPYNSNDLSYSYNPDYLVISDPLVINNIPDDGHSDYRVRAQIGYYTEIAHPFMDVYVYKFTGEAGDWSDTQTITVGASLLPVSQDFFPTVAVFVAVSIVIAAVVIVSMHRKRRRRVDVT